MSIEALKQSWQYNCGDFPPIAHQFKWEFDERWFRIHALPDSKRYPEDKTEYTEIFRRHDLILTDLFGEGRSYFLLTGNFSLTSAPARNRKILNLGFQENYWDSFLWTDDDEDEPIYGHCYFDQLTWKPNSVHELFRLVADDEVENVIFFSSENNILYHTYDGGADIIFNKTETRDFYREKYNDWLSPHPAGF